MGKRPWPATVVALAWCAWYGLRVVWPAAGAQTHGFAAHYTAARLLAWSPREYWRVYDDRWFAAHIERAGLPGVRDIFNVQPPAMGLLLLPLAGLDPGDARAVWTILSLGMLAGGLLLLARALNMPRAAAWWALPACLLYAPLAENLRQGQVYLLLFGLLCLLFWALARDRPGAGGLALGAMLVAKTAALWMWPLLLVERRRRLVAWAVLAAGAIGLATLAWLGPRPWLAYAAQLPRLLTMPERYVTAYQTVTSLTGHLLVYDARWNPWPLADWPAGAAALNVALLVGALILSAWWARPRRGREGGALLALALFAALAVPNAPVAEGYHYVLALPSLVVAAWWAWRSGAGRWSWAVLALAAVLLGAPLPYRSPHLAAGWPAVLAYPRLYGAYVLWAWLGWALNQPDRGGDSGPRSHSGLRASRSEKRANPIAPRITDQLYTHPESFVEDQNAWNRPIAAPE